VNIILVVHPRKEDDRVALNISSVFGTAKATQEADLVMILQRVDGGAYIDIRKNRYDGQLGKIPVDFNQMTRCFYESDREMEEVPTGNGNSSQHRMKSSSPK
jgi:twinkle protein